jgi:hypothetical protein
MNFYAISFFCRSHLHASLRRVFYRPKNRCGPPRAYLSLRLPSSGRLCFFFFLLKSTLFFIQQKTAIKRAFLDCEEKAAFSPLDLFNKQAEAESELLSCVAVFFTYP